MDAKTVIIKRILPYLTGSVCAVALCFVMFKYLEKRSNKEIESGVYTVMTVEATGTSTFCGFAIKYNYIFRDIYYDGIVYQDMGFDMGIGSLGATDVGKRYFLKVDPSNPRRNTIMHNDHVPEWFALETPLEGWPTKPTEDELREMMVQDSLKRGIR